MLLEKERHKTDAKVASSHIPAVFPRNFWVTLHGNKHYDTEQQNPTTDTSSYLAASVNPELCFIDTCAKPLSHADRAVSLRSNLTESVSSYVCRMVRGGADCILYMSCTHDCSNSRSSQKKKKKKKKVKFRQQQSSSLTTKTGNWHFQVSGLNHYMYKSCVGWINQWMKQNLTVELR